MNIGIIVFSRTGNTLSVAEKAAQQLRQAGHTVDLERIEAEGQYPPGTHEVNFTRVPDIGRYDALLFCSFVEAFSLTPVMSVYLSNLPSCSGKQVSLLVTHHFPFPFLGGTRAIKQMRRICEAKDAIIRGTGIIDWSRKDREAQITRCVAALSGSFLAGPVS